MEAVKRAQKNLVDIRMVTAVSFKPLRCLKPEALNP